MPVRSREIRLRSRPVGLPTPDNFELVEVELPDPGPGQLLVRNLYMSVDPYMRGRMVERKSYVPPYQIGQTLDGGAVGQVVVSNHPNFPEGTYVLSNMGWREYFLSDGTGLMPVDPSLAPIEAYLGVMGMPGLTAYVGLLDIGQPKEGETVFVSGAAGAVGSVVCQIAKLKGCRVVGSAGSERKVRWLLDVAGVDAAFNYKETPNLHRTLAELCPDGIHVYFDNVGGDHLEAALGNMANFGRIVACGMISLYNATEPPPGPRNMANFVTRRLRMQGFIVSDHWDRMPAFVQDMAGWIREGKIRWEQTVVEGIEHAPDAFIGLFRGENLGKMLVKL